MPACLKRQPNLVDEQQGAGLLRKDASEGVALSIPQQGQDKPNDDLQGTRSDTLSRRKCPCMQGAFLAVVWHQPYPSLLALQYGSLMCLCF